MTIDDEEREATRQLINGLRSGVNVAAAEIKSQREQLDAMRQQLTAAVSVASGHGQHAGARQLPYGCRWTHGRNT